MLNRVSLAQPDLADDSPAASPASAPRTRKRPSSCRQVAKNTETRRRLVEAAGVVVGAHGYAGASVARITERAGVAHGAFYLHFASRQAMFDVLLPEISSGMLDTISTAIRDCTTFEEIERQGLKANFEYLSKRPEIDRVMNEAELYAPQAFKQFLGDLQARYLRSLQRSRARGDIRDYSDDQLRTIVALLAGARSFLLKIFARDGAGAVSPPSDEQMATYLDVFLHGLKRPRENTLEQS